MKRAEQFEYEWYQANWPGDYKSEGTATGPFRDKWRLADLIEAVQRDALLSGAAGAHGMSMRDEMPAATEYQRGYEAGCDASAKKLESMAP